ncbi:hypothetical protein FIBSPDRAFT_959557 [Athelia psychrophila]|uniref:Uncharacterized protein n=1 Tax=Athelia psychrophila TaxID=1759441 RepID=A0A166DE24_9AGAM|nr:hypothetical protein FIBSPDRAFT_959557 [Fibularhizoctonia sp. CBS 109695]
MTLRPAPRGALAEMHLLPSSGVEVEFDPVSIPLLPAVCGRSALACAWALMMLPIGASLLGITCASAVVLDMTGKVSAMRGVYPAYRCSSGPSGTLLPSSHTVLHPHTTPGPALRITIVIAELHRTFTMARQVYAFGVCASQPAVVGRCALVLVLGQNGTAVCDWVLGEG